VDNIGFYYTTKFRLRPALSMNETRQLLIVGSMSSGTSQVAHDLREFLQLEVGHEDSDTTQYAVRDGTVSWFHGIRFLDRSEPQERITTLVDICNVAWRIHSWDKIQWNYPWSNYGTDLILFGPTNFSVPHFHPNFRKAYLQACQQTIFQELGCELTKSCRGAPFQRILLQTRQPWRIVTSLVIKYCQGGEWDAPTSLLLLFQAIYPNYAHVWFPTTKNNSSQEEPVDGMIKLKHCSDQMATYGYLWYNNLLDAFEKLSRQETTNRPGECESSLNYRVYPIENTTICQVASMAGFDILQDRQNGCNDNLVIYTPNIQPVHEFCLENGDASFGNTENQFNSRNRIYSGSSTDGNVVSHGQEQKLDIATVREMIPDHTRVMIDELALRMGYVNVW
jgi:hypothetical protein